MARVDGAGLRLRYARLCLIATIPLATACSDAAGPTAPSRLEDQPRRLMITASQGHSRTVSRIYLADANGRNIVRLTSGYTPAWSPDGKRVAFTRDDGMIYVIGTDGGNETPLAKGQSPAWSPDGRQFAFTSEEGISVMNVDGSGVKALIRHDFRDDTYEPWDMGVSKPAWSPDGNRIAFEHLGDGDIQPAQVYVMNADGSDPRRLSARYTTFRYAESDPAWSPDGSRVAFWSYGFGIAVSNMTDGLVTTVYSHFPYVAYGAKPAWSPDGKFVTFNTFASSPATATDVLMVPVSGDGPQSILIQDAYGARWSPDGSRIVFVSNRIAKSK